MSRIFYKIADLVHPVAGGETGEARRDLWEKTIEAYESDDLKTLRECEIVANIFFRDLPDALTDADLKTLIDAYRGKIAEYKEKNKEIVESFPYNVGDLLADEEYIAKELAKLAEEPLLSGKAEEYYKALEDILPTLDGKTSDAITKPSKESPRSACLRKRNLTEEMNMNKIIDLINASVGR